VLTAPALFWLGPSCLPRAETHITIERATLPILAAPILLVNGPFVPILDTVVTVEMGGIWTIYSIYGTDCRAGGGCC